MTAQRKYKMTWNRKMSRWYKKLDKQQYSVGIRTLQTDYPHLFKSATQEGSYLAANQWWLDQLKTLTTHPHEFELNGGIEIRCQLGNWCELDKRDETRQLIAAEAEALRSALRNGTKLTCQPARKTIMGTMTTPVMGQRWYLDTLPVNPFTSNEIDYHGESLPIWLERLEQVKKHEQWERKNGGLTFDAAITTFLDNVTAKNGKPLSASRKANLRLYLEKFRKWKGNDKLQVEGFDLIRYKSDLLAMVANGELAQATARSQMIGVKQFYQWLSDANLIASIPKNLRSSILAIGQGKGKKVVWTDEQVKIALREADDRMKLFLLLHLNCGMTSADISAIEHTDIIDWDTDTGLVNWTRKKTGEGGTLNYQLWSETFALLKKFRTEHPTLVLTTRTGQPLKLSTENDGHYERKTDMIGLAFRRWNQSKKLGLPPLKELRKTARNKLELHPEFARYAQSFLQQAGRSVDEKWYRNPDQQTFTRCLAWLREQFIK